MKIGFDNEKYLKMQSQHIRERIAKFDDKLYLEFGGKLFDDYHASRGLNAKGSGLGLHICKVLITLSGGTIRVDSKHGEWCRFTFTLPEPPAQPRQRRGGKKEG